MALNASAVDYYVATNGNDSASGTSTNTPFATIQKAADMVSAGGTVFIRGGTYHESVVVDNVNGSAGNRVVFKNYNGEKVTLDGTESVSDIGGAWSNHSGNIYKTTLNKDIWQLFVDGRMQVIARWPNADTNPTDPLQTKPGSSEAVDGTWWSRETTWANADMPGTLAYSQAENNPAYQDLAGTGIDFTGGSIIYSFLAQGGDGNQERSITNHVAGSNILQYDTYTGPGTKKGLANNGKFFILEHLDVLDQAEEWYYTPSNNTLYVWGDPAGKEVRGRTLKRAFTINNNCSYITIQGLDFFANTFRSGADGFVIEDCSISYPDASRRLLGEYPAESNDAVLDYGTYIADGSFAMTNCVFRYSELGLLVDNPARYGSSLHNNLFHHISMLGIGKNGAIQQVNSFTRNTFHTASNRGAIKTNADPQATRKQQYNILRNWGYLQVEDGSGFQVAGSDITGCERSYNWVYDAYKYGYRWDGHDGLTGLNHHNVGVNLRGAFQIKGDDHDTHNNTGLGGLAKNDFIILDEYSDSLGYNENINSRTWNNLGDKLAGHRAENVAIWPIPGDHTNNWNGYLESGSASDQLRNAPNFDFRPKAGSGIIDAGKVIPGITDGYLGAAPDIGAYEYGDPHYWIPGYQAAQASTPIPPDGTSAASTDADLMYLIGYEGVSADIYLGVSSNSLSFLTSQADPTNVVVLADHAVELADNATYYWRVDTVMAGSSVVTGEVWSFTTGLPLSEDPFICIADTRCTGTSTNNYGTANPLRIQNGQQNRMYAKFEVSGVTGIQSAVLKLRVDQGPIPDIDVYPASGSWEEMTLTGANDTLVWGSLLDTQTNCTVGTTYSFDVSSFVTTAGIYTFAITTDTTLSGLKINSRESGAYAPELIVTSGTAAQLDYSKWAYDFGLIGSNALRSTDLEPDGMDNLTEYALGGNPTNADAVAILPTAGIIPDLGTNWLEYVYRRRNDYVARGLDYTVEAGTNLVSGGWGTNGVVEVDSGPVDAEFDAVTNRVSTTEMVQQFLRLRIEETE